MMLDDKGLDIALARKCWGWDDLATALDMRRTSLYLIRRRKQIKPVTAGKIAAALNCPVEEIVS
jgi:DNA-binding Xre family transcriptional regulator